MFIAVDFDGVVVRKDRPFADTTTPMQFMPHAKEGLESLKRAGHVMLLYSARSNRSLLYTSEWDPLVRAGVRRPHEAAWSHGRELHWARYHQMLQFVEDQLPGVFDAIDDGLQGKPMADLFIDDRALEFGVGAKGWPDLMTIYGAHPQALLES
jgi:hypothetical protein